MPSIAPKILRLILTGGVLLTGLLTASSAVYGRSKIAVTKRVQSKSYIEEDGSFFVARHYTYTVQSEEGRTFSFNKQYNPNISKVYVSRIKAWTQNGEERTDVSSEYILDGEVGDSSETLESPFNRLKKARYIKIHFKNVKVGSQLHVIISRRDCPFYQNFFAYRRDLGLLMPLEKGSEFTFYSKRELHYDPRGTRHVRIEKKFPNSIMVAVNAAGKLWGADLEQMNGTTDIEPHLKEDEYPYQYVFTTKKPFCLLVIAFP